MKNGFASASTKEAMEWLVSGVLLLVSAPLWFPVIILGVVVRIIVIAFMVGWNLVRVK